MARLARKTKHHRKILDRLINSCSLLIRSQCTHLKDNSTFNIRYCTIYRCAKTSVDMRVARDRVALFLSVSVSTISPVLIRRDPSRSARQKGRVADARGRGISCALSPFGDRFTSHSRLGKKRGRRRSCIYGEMQRRSERGMREGKTKRTGREGGFTAEGGNS